MVILICIVYASRVKENRIMDIATFETLSNDEKAKVFAELARPNIEKKNAYTLAELLCMNDVERFSILSDEEKQKVLNKERPLRNAKCEIAFIRKHIEECRFLGPDITRDVEFNMLVKENSVYDTFLVKEKESNDYEIVRRGNSRDIGYDLYQACLQELKKLINIPTENF